MSDTPKSFRELAREMRESRVSRARTYASENADHYRGFDAGQLRAAEYVERLADEWERRMNDVAKKGGTYFGSRFIISHMLGAKERR